jgi:hypothetical protein
MRQMLAVLELSTWLALCAHVSSRTSGPGAQDSSFLALIIFFLQIVSHNRLSLITQEALNDAKQEVD